MSSPILILTAVESGFGFLLTSTVLYILLQHGRKIYHYLFAAFLVICAAWDLGIFLAMFRNQHAEELVLIGRAIILPCIFIPALLFNFANQYTGRPIRWAVISVWLFTGVTFGFILAGVFYQIGGIYKYAWGNIFRVVPSFMDPLIFVFWFGINLTACWLLIKSGQRAASKLEQRHHRYVVAGFLAVTLAVVKALVTMGWDISFLLPAGMFLNDVFVAVIGLAIIKDRLFDIRVIIKASTLYSLLAAVLIFIYSFSEHLLITFFGELTGRYSEMAHLLSIAAGIAALMPVKRGLEHRLEKFFSQKVLEF